MKESLINKIINISINFIAVSSLILNLIIFFALRNSVYLFPRFIPPALALSIILLVIIKDKLSIPVKTWILITILFLAGCFTLLLGLLDMTSLWFILAIIFSLFIAKKNESLLVFFISFVFILIAGILLMAKIPYMPIDYKFQNCQFACISVRIIHFLLIGFLIYYILHTFFSTIKDNFQELQVKATELEQLNVTLNTEMNEKKVIQQKLLDAIIVTEENERKRLASDLHDGLGPVLSAINLYYQAYIDEPDQEARLELEKKLKGMINNAIEDVSRISHNISPHILETYGLIAALETFKSQLPLGENLKFSMTFDQIIRFDLKAELTVYRTLTELINNSIKHASASLLSIEGSVTGDLLTINYRDNGKGFSIDEALNSKTGIGLKNIFSRIGSLNGTIRFTSASGHGMEATLVMPYLVTG